MALFGGGAGSIYTPSLLDETWELRGALWRKLELTTAPTARWHHAMVYDPTRRAITLLGGHMESNPGFYSITDDIWDLAAGRWTRRAGGVVTPRDVPNALVWDSHLHRATAFSGGLGQDSVWYRDTVSIDDSGLASIIPALTGAVGYSLGTDPLSGDPIVFGGRVGGAVSDPRTWRWNGREWSPVSGSGPSPRTEASLALDPVRRRLVLFGGKRDAATLLGDTWEWDGVEWHEILASGPSARAGHQMAYWRSANRVVLVGGYGNEAQGRFRDTWAWDGSSWAPLDQDTPVTQNGFCLFEDPLGDGILLLAENRDPSIGGDFTYELAPAGWSQVVSTPIWNGTGGVLTSRALGLAVVDAYGRKAWAGRGWVPAIAGASDQPWNSRAAYDQSRGEFISPRGLETYSWTGGFSAVVRGVQMPSSVQAGHPLTLHADVQEFAPGITYQWQLPTDTASRATGQDTPTLTINPALTRDSQQLTLRIATPCGTFDAVKLSPIVIPCPEDLYGGDAFVDINDLQLLLLYWNQPIPPGFTFNPDINGDGLVNTADLVRLLVRFGRPCE